MLNKSRCVYQVTAGILNNITYKVYCLYFEFQNVIILDTTLKVRIQVDGLFTLLAYMLYP